MRRSHSHPNSSLVEHGRSTMLGAKILAKTEFLSFLEEVNFICSFFAIHDIAKDNLYFQKKLDGDKTIGAEGNHSGSSALIAFCLASYTLEQNPNLLKDSPWRELLPLMIFSIISAHHSKIKKIKIQEHFLPSINAWLKTKSETSSLLIDIVSNELKVSIDKDLFFQYLNERLKEINLFNKKLSFNAKRDLDIFLCVRALLGNLVKSDVMSAICQSKGLQDIEYLDFENFEVADYSKMTFIDKEDTELNKLRSSSQKEAVENFLKINPQHVLIDAPTGLGKSICMLKILQKNLSSSKVFYLAPRTNVVDQTGDIINGFLGKADSKNKTAILHHLRKEIKDSENENLEDEFEKIIIETLNAGTIITTFNRFAEILSNLNRNHCTFFHGIKNSFFIIDEYHSFSIKQLPLYLNLFQSMSKLFGCKFIFASATPPSFDFLQKSIKILDGEESFKLQKIINESVFNHDHISKRREYHVLGDFSSYDLLMNEVNKKHEQNKSCLIGVNLVEEAITIAQKINADYCITANLTPIDRKRQLKEIEIKLKNKEAIVVVATSVIQAGLDLDFDQAFLSLRGLMELIQVAGRCGRNYLTERGTCKVFLFQLRIPSKKCFPTWAIQRYVDKGINLKQDDQKEYYIVKKTIETVLKNRNHIYTEKELENIMYSSSFDDIIKTIKSKLICSNFYDDEKYFVDDSPEYGIYFSDLEEQMKVSSEENKFGVCIFTDVQMLNEVLDKIEQFKTLKAENIIKSRKKMRDLLKEIYEILSPITISRNKVFDVAEKLMRSNPEIKELEEIGSLYILNTNNKFYCPKNGWKT